mgnify:CR=1 FL=1
MLLIIINESECVLMVTFKQQTRKQHYYPRFLLKYFANSDNKINAYVRYKDKFLTVNYNNVCCRKYAYETDDVDNILENQLSKYEAKMSIILNDLFLNNFNEPSSETKDFIIRFIILQYYRTDYGRLILNNHLNDTLNNTHTLNPAYYRINPFTHIDIKNKYNEIKDVNDLFTRYNLLDLIYEDITIPDNYDLHVAWCDFNNERFITSDNPVIIGCGCIFLSISPEVCFVIQDNRRFGNEGWTITLPYDDFEALNYNIINNATNFVLSRYPFSITEKLNICNKFKG